MKKPNEPQQPVEKKQSKEQEYLEGWKRARAELDNFRKRVAQEDSQRQDQLKRRLIEPLLEVADNFNAIVSHVPESQMGDSWTQGVLHVARQLDQLLMQYDVKKIGEVGEVFNPQIHEAAGEAEGDTPGQVMEVVRPGYQVGSIVIRPARVKVST